jgi:hypothetical protein
VLLGPLVLMMHTFPHDFDFPDSWAAGLSTRTPAFWAWKAEVVEHDSVRTAWPAEEMSELAKAKIASLAKTRLPH